MRQAQDDHDAPRTRHMVASAADRLRAERAGGCGVERVHRDLVPVDLLNPVTIRPGVAPHATADAADVGRRRRRRDKQGNPVAVSLHVDDGGDGDRSRAGSWQATSSLQLSWGARRVPRGRGWRYRGLLASAIIGDGGYTLVQVISDV